MRPRSRLHLGEASNVTEQQKRIDSYIKIRDGLTMAAEGFKEIVMSYASQEVHATAEVPPDLSMVSTKDAVGRKGVFRLADVKANENNAAFQRLKAYLEAHKGKASVSGQFCWIMKDGSVGMKYVQRV
jgi:hypothetical protein